MANFSFTQSGFEAYQGVINVADTTTGNALSISATKQVLPAATGQDFGSTSLRWDPFLGATDIAGAVTADASIWNIGSGQFYKDASGNIGVGTTSPGAPLHVQKSLAGALLVSLENTSNSASANARFLLKNDSGLTAGLQFLSSTAATPSLLTLYNAANAALAFSTNAVERGRFAATGELVLGNGDTSATPTSSTLRGTNGAGTDIAGASLTVLAGRGTGAGAPGSLNFQTATVGTTGSVLQTATTRMSISGTAVTFSFPVLPDGNGTRGFGSSSLYWGPSYLASVFTTGAIGHGTLSPVSNGLQVGGGSTYRELRLQRNVDGAVGQALTFFRSRGTEAVPTALLTNDAIGSTIYSAHDGTSYVSCASFGAVPVAAPTTGIVQAAFYIGVQPAAGGAITNYFKLVEGAVSPVANGGTSSGTTALRWSTTFTQALDVSGKAGFGGILASAATCPIDVKTTFAASGPDNGAIRIERYNTTNAGYLENIGGVGLYDGSRYTISGQRNPDSTTASGILQSSGVVTVYVNAGLTPGTTFTPTSRLAISDTAITATLPISTTSGSGTQFGGTSGPTGRVLISGSSTINDAGSVVLRGATTGANPGATELWATDGTTGALKVLVSASAVTSTVPVSPSTNGGTTSGTSTLRWGTTFTQALDVSGKAGFGGITAATAATSIDVKSSYVSGSASNGAIRVERYNSTAAAWIENIVGGLSVFDGSQYFGSATRTPDSTASSGFIATAGALQFYANTGLTAGTAFTPTVRLTVDATNTTLANNLVAGTNTWTVGTNQLVKTTAGNFIFGYTTTRAIEVAGAGAAGSTNTLLVEGTNTTSYPGMTLVMNSPTTANLAASMTFARTRGSVVGDNTLVNASDSLGGFGWAGGDGTDVRTKAAEIYAIVDGTPGANNMPGAIIFATTPSGSAVPSVALRIYNDGSILSMRGPLGYGAGSGGTITQATSKATGVTLNKASGQITTAADALASNASVPFTFTNSLIAVGDQVLVQRQSGGTAGAYEVWCDSVAAGSCVIYLRNRTAGSLSEAVVLNFKVIKGATA